MTLNYLAKSGFKWKSIDKFKQIDKIFEVCSLQS
jgi:hypothetical protein